MRRAVRPLQLVLSATLLIALYRETAIADVAANLADSAPDRLLGSCGLVLAMHGLIAWRLRLLVEAHGVRLTISDALAAHLASLFYKLFVPGGTVGSVAARVLCVRRELRGRSAALPVVFVERIGATLGLCLVGLACWVFERPPMPSTPATAMAGCLVVVSVVTSILLAPASARLTRALISGLDRAFLSDAFERWLDAVAPIRSLLASRFSLLLSVSLAVHVLGVAVFCALASALAIPGDLFAWGWIRAVVILVTMLPVSVAGLGVRDVSLIYLLGFYGVGVEEALALASLVFVVTVLMVALLGGLSELARALGTGTRATLPDAETCSADAAETRGTTRV